MEKRVIKKRKFKLLIIFIGIIIFFLVINYIIIHYDDLRLRFFDNKVMDTDFFSGEWTSTADYQFNINSDNSFELKLANQSEINGVIDEITSKNIYLTITTDEFSYSDKIQYKYSQDEWILIFPDGETEILLKRNDHD